MLSWQIIRDAETHGRPATHHLDVTQAGPRVGRVGWAAPPNQGSFDAEPRIFFGWSAAVILVVGVVAALVLFLLAPRLAFLHPLLPRVLVWAIIGAVVLILLWWQLIALSYALRTPVLPERLAERGPLLVLMRYTSKLADRFGRAGLGGAAAVKVYALWPWAKAQSERCELRVIPRCWPRTWSRAC